MKHTNFRRGVSMCALAFGLGALTAPLKRWADMQRCTVEVINRSVFFIRSRRLSPVFIAV